MNPSSLPPKPDNKRFILLPYTNRKCEKFAFRLKNLVDSNFIDLDFNVAFKRPRTIGHLFYGSLDSETLPYILVVAKFL